MIDHLKLKSDILQEIIHQCGKLDELEKAGIDFTQTERDLLLAVKPVLDNLDQGHPAEDSTSRFPESPGLYRQVFEMLATGIMIVDEASHTILEINQAACNLLNRSREELLGSTCYLHGCAEGLDTCPVRNVQKNIFSWEMMLRQHSNTESFPVKKDVIPFRLGKRRYLLESFVDLQSTKKTEKELAERKQKL